MIPHKKLLTIVTVLLVVGAKADAQQSFSIGDLRTIESLIGRKDCGALYQFLSAKPGLVSGTDPLARELQGFLRNVESGSLDCFAAPVAQRAVPPKQAGLVAGLADSARIY